MKTWERPAVNVWTAGGTNLRNLKDHRPAALRPWGEERRRCGARNPSWGAHKWRAATGDMTWFVVVLGLVQGKGGLNCFILLFVSLGESLGGYSDNLE